MSTVHFIFQGESGIGKNYIASLIAQHRRDQGKAIKCFNTTNTHGIFTLYKELNVKTINIVEKNEINIEHLDCLITDILSDKQRDFIIYSSSSSFIPFFKHLIEHEIFEQLNSTGNKFYIHTVIAGGRALKKTASGLNSLANHIIVKNKIVIWINAFLGEIAANGKNFEDMKFYQENKNSIFGIIYMPNNRTETFVSDINKMQKENLTFKEAIDSLQFDLMAKQRLKMVQREIWQQLDNILIY